MFIGHWAPALATATHPRAPGLGTLFVAGQLVDWGFFTLLLTGAERMRVVPGITAMNPMDLYHMPYTHSLAGSAVWAAGFAVLVWLWRRDWLGAGIAAGVVISHWFLDLLVHRPDLTLAGAPPKLGFGLWNFPRMEIPLELGLTVGAFAWYVSRTRPRMLTGTRGLWLLAVLPAAMLLVQAINWFGPEPAVVDANTSLLAFFAYGLVTAIAWWLGRSRAPEWERQ